MTDQDKYTLAGSWERVKVELLNRYYDLIDIFRDYQYMVLSNKDNFEYRKQLTSKISALWTLLKDYGKAVDKIKDFKKWDNFMKKLIEKKGMLNYEGICRCVAMLATIMKSSGLTNIEFRQVDPRYALGEAPG